MTGPRRACDVCGKYDVIVSAPATGLDLCERCEARRVRLAEGREARRTFWAGVAWEAPTDDIGDYLDRSPATFADGSARND